MGIKQDIINSLGFATSYIEITDKKDLGILYKKVAKQNVLLTEDFPFAYFIKHLSVMDNESIDKSLEEDKIFKDIKNNLKVEITDFAKEVEGLTVIPSIDEEVIKLYDQNKSIFFIDYDNVEKIASIIQNIIKGDYIAISSDNNIIALFKDIKEVTGDKLYKVSDGNYILTSMEIESFEEAKIEKEITFKYGFRCNVKKAFDYLDNFDSVEEAYNAITEFLKNFVKENGSNIEYVWIDYMYKDYIIVTLESYFEDDYFYKTYKVYIDSNLNITDFIEVERVVEYKEVGTYKEQKTSEKPAIKSEENYNIEETENSFTIFIKDTKDKEVIKFEVKGNINAFYKDGVLYGVEFSKETWDEDKIKEVLSENDLVEYIKNNIVFNKRDVKFLKATDEEKRYVLGIVLEPNDGDNGADYAPDLQGDIYSAEDIEKAAFNWMLKYQNIGIMHEGEAGDKVVPVESYLAPVDLYIDGVKITKGTWLLGALVKDDTMWESVKKGDFTGWSIGGYGTRESA